MNILHINSFEKVKCLLEGNNFSDFGNDNYDYYINEEILISSSTKHDYYHRNKGDLLCLDDVLSDGGWNVLSKESYFWTHDDEMLCFKNK